MKKHFSIIWIITLIIFLSLFTVRCKKAEPAFDITNGSWGVFLELPDSSPAVVYAFQGSLSRGDVIFNNEVRGAYTVNNTTVFFTVNHYDAESELYLYAYTGSITGPHNMSGTLVITFPDTTTVNGTWRAER
jgi:hypothetical protein